MKSKLMKSTKKISLICILNKRPMHGYELMKELEKRMGKKINPSFIYPLLREFEKEGYLKSKIEKTGKRKIKKYIITKSGKEFCRDVEKQIKKILKEFFNQANN